MQDIIKNYSQFITEANSIADLSNRDERPMVSGIAQILRGVKDKENRQELAERQVKQFKREKILFDYAEFFKLCGL